MGTRRIPLAVKVAYSAFVAVLVPYYWHAYGPQNFLYFCDVALLVTLAGVWAESSFLLSLEAVAILVPQTLWIADFALGGHFLGMTAYMHDPTLTLFVRGLSLFHGWLPVLLVWAVWRIGYDRRALPAQCVAGTLLLLACYLGFAPPDHAGGHRMAVDINYVYGMDEAHQQTAMPPLAWLALLATAMPVAMYLPAHLVLKRLFGRRVMPAGEEPSFRDAAGTPLVPRSAKPASEGTPEDPGRRAPRSGREPNPEPSLSPARTGPELT